MRSANCSSVIRKNRFVTERQIRIFGDPVLKTVSDPIKPTDDVTGLVEDLLETVEVPGRAGVAAPQIGVNQRAFSYNVDGVIGYILNPVLVEVSGDPEEMDEGCLSIPGFYFPRMRYPYARVTGVDMDGNPVELSGEGVMAQALQHETDHLDGKLFVDGMDKEGRRAAMGAIRNAPWF
jgi:peptide deformylase